MNRRGKSVQWVIFMHCSWKRGFGELARSSSPNPAFYRVYYVFLFSWGRIGSFLKGGVESFVYGRQILSTFLYFFFFVTYLFLSNDNTELYVFSEYLFFCIMLQIWCFFIIFSFWIGKCAIKMLIFLIYSVSIFISIFLILFNCVNFENVEIQMKIDYLYRDAVSLNYIVMHLKFCETFWIDFLFKIFWDWNYFERFLSAHDFDNIHSRVFSLSNGFTCLCFSRRNYVSKVWSKVRLCRSLIIEETPWVRKIWSTCRWLTPWWPEPDARMIYRDRLTLSQAIRVLLDESMLHTRIVWIIASRRAIIVGKVRDLFI